MDIFNSKLSFQVWQLWCRQFLFFMEEERCYILLSLKYITMILAHIIIFVIIGTFVFS